MCQIKIIQSSRGDGAILQSVHIPPELNLRNLNAAGRDQLALEFMEAALNLLKNTATVPYSEEPEPEQEFYILDLAQYLERQIAFSERTFGPGNRTKPILDHIRKELIEIEAEPLDLEEWIDVTMMALDGACRAGHSPQDIAKTLATKLAKNEARTWPDWRTADPDKAIEHVR